MNIINNRRRGIQNVLTTIIILVASVTLSVAVVLYGGTLFQGAAQTESLSVTGAQVWVHGTDPVGKAWGAAGVRNTGDKLLAVDMIQVRGVAIPFNQWYTDTTVTPSLFQKSYNFTGWRAGTGGLVQQASSPAGACPGFTHYVQVDVDGAGGDEAICANAGSGPVSLAPGSQAIIYFKLTNGTLTSLDSGVSTTVNIFAGTVGSPLSVTVQGKTNTG